MSNFQTSKFTVGHIDGKIVGDQATAISKMLANTRENFKKSGLAHLCMGLALTEDQQNYSFAYPADRDPTNLVLDRARAYMTLNALAAPHLQGYAVHNITRVDGIDWIEGDQKAIEGTKLVPMVGSVRNEMLNGEPEMNYSLPFIPAAKTHKRALRVGDMYNSSKMHGIKVTDKVEAITFAADPKSGTVIIGGNEDNLVHLAIANRDPFALTNGDNNVFQHFSDGRALDRIGINTDKEPIGIVSFKDPNGQPFVEQYDLGGVFAGNGEMKLIGERQMLPKNIVYAGMGQKGHAAYLNVTTGQFWYIPMNIKGIPELAAFFA